MTKFNIISVKWLTYHQNNVSAVTLDMYKIKVEKLNHYFMNKNIKNIKVIEIQDYINNLYIKNSFSKSTIKKYKVTLNLIFKFAIKLGIMNINPMFNIDIPKINTSVQVENIDINTICKIIDNRNVKCNGLYAFIMLFTGMRKSELVSLKYEDIHIKEKYIKLQRKVSYVRNKSIIINELKNSDKFRCIEIPTLLVNELNKIGVDKKIGFIFKNETNGVLTKYQNQKMWTRYCENILGVKIKQHQLRHTYMPMLYKSAVDIKTAQELLGHKDISTTLNIYTHLDKEYKRKNIGKLDNYIDENFSSNE